MRFDEGTDTANPASIKYLKEHGTDFERHRVHGCKQRDVVNGLKGLFRDQGITWVTFQGQDFNLILSKTESKVFNLKIFNYNFLLGFVVQDSSKLKIFANTS